MIAIIARAELPRYVRYWVALLSKHEATASGKCPTCSRWWHRVSAPCSTWKWAHAFLTIAPARATVPANWIDNGAPQGADQTLAACPPGQDNFLLRAEATVTELGVNDLVT